MRAHENNQMYNSTWRRLSKEYLKSNPFCRRCAQDGSLVAATEVDHVKPHCGDLTLFWDQDNWQPLCVTCHSRKTATEDGGFGNG